MRKIVVLGSLALVAALSADGGEAGPPGWVGGELPMPPVAGALQKSNTRDIGGLGGPCGISGAVRVWDPVNGELLQLGGNCGGVEKADGFAGNWRTSDGRTWTRLTAASAVLDPLRSGCLEARMPARDAENAARNIHFSDLGAGEAAAMKDRPARLMAEAVRIAAGAVGAMEAALPAARGWEKQSVERGLALAGKAVASLRAAHDGFAAGQVNAELLAKCFDGQWKLDEAAGCLASGPGAIWHPVAAYDPERRSIVLFGGSHGDYVVNDTWIYECAGRAWRRAWSGTAPAPRCASGSTNRRKDKNPKKATLNWDQESKQLVLSGGLTMIDYIVQQACYMSLKGEAGDWRFDTGTGEWTGAGGVAPGSRTYRSDACKFHDPRWFDSEAKGSRAETAQWHGALKPNVWTKVAPPPGGRVMNPQSWGASPLDPDHDRIYVWTGGHEADCTDVLPTYHIAVNRWSIGYVPAELGKGIGFDGRPDCANHTYKRYAYDAAQKKLVMVHWGGTSVYNPDRADYDFSFDTGFPTPNYLTAMAGTPSGLFLWTSGALRLFDAQARAWKGAKVAGKVPPPTCDSYAMQYDSKRNAIWLFNSLGKDQPRQVSLLDLAAMTVETVQPGREEISTGMGPSRESAYIPEADLVLFNNFAGNRQVAFDPEKRQWLLVGTREPGGDPKSFRTQGGVGSCGMAYDARRGLVWQLGCYSTIFVLKVDAKSLVRE